MADTFRSYNKPEYFYTLNPSYFRFCNLMSSNTETIVRNFSYVFILFFKMTYRVLRPKNIEQIILEPWLYFGYYNKANSL